MKNRPKQNTNSSTRILRSSVSGLTTIRLIAWPCLLPFVFSNRTFADDSATRTPPPAENGQAASTSNAIPEEARRHEIIGTTTLRDAKAPEDFAAAVEELKQAVELAPNWKEARWKLAVAREAAADYKGAYGDLTAYLKMGLPDDEARKVKDKLYVLEAKVAQKTRQDAADFAKRQAEAQQSAETQRKETFARIIQSFAGNWRADIWVINNLTNQTVLLQGGYGYSVSIQGPYINVINPALNDWDLRGEITGQDVSSIRWTVPARRNPGNNYASSYQDLPVTVQLEIPDGHTVTRIKWTNPEPRWHRDGYYYWSTDPTDARTTDMRKM